MATRRRSQGRLGHSAFAAGFLSFLMPGLGHAYLGYWLRAAAWLFLPIVAMAALAASLLGPSRTELLARLLDPDVLVAALAVVLIDLLYRLAAVIDAWRLGRDRSIGSPTTRTASGLGLIVMAGVLVLSHVAIAQPVLYARDVLGTFDGEGGDDSAVPTLDDLGDAFGHLRQSPPASTSPGATPASIESPPPDVAIEPWTGTDRLDILLLGIDSGRPGRVTYLTDTMMVVSVDPGSGRMAIISLPRDTVNVPLPEAWTAARQRFGSRYGAKINTLYATARFSDGLFPGNDRTRGYKALMGAFSELYGLDIRFYAAVNLAGFRGAVQTLGGLVVDVDRPLLDPAYPADDGRGHLKLYIPPGIRSMNGQLALAYARSRKTTSDFDRSDRQQRLIAAIGAQLDLPTLLAPGVIGGLRKDFRAHVTTNIPADMLPRLVSLAADVDVAKRRSLVLSHEKDFSTECNQCQADGQYKLFPNVPKIRGAVKNVLRRGGRASGNG